MCFSARGNHRISTKAVPFDSDDLSLSEIINPVSKFEVFVELSTIYIQFSISPELGHGDEFIISFSEFSTLYSTSPWRHGAMTSILGFFGDTEARRGFFQDNTGLDGDILAIVMDFSVFIFRNGRVSLFSSSFSFKF